MGSSPSLVQYEWPSLHMETPWKALGIHSHPQSPNRKETEVLVLMATLALEKLWKTASEYHPGKDVSILLGAQKLSTQNWWLVMAKISPSNMSFKDLGSDTMGVGFETAASTTWFNKDCKLNYPINVGWDSRIGFFVMPQLKSTAWYQWYVYHHFFWPTAGFPCHEFEWTTERTDVRRTVNGLTGWDSTKNGR